MDNRIGEPPAWLYVAPLPVRVEAPHGPAYIRHVERWVIWDYVQEHARLPVCNKK